MKSASSGQTTVATPTIRTRWSHPPSGENRPGAPAFRSGARSGSGGGWITWMFSGRETNSPKPERRSSLKKGTPTALDTNFSIDKIYRQFCNSKRQNCSGRPSCPCAHGAEAVSEIEILNNRLDLNPLRVETACIQFLDRDGSCFKRLILAG